MQTINNAEKGDKIIMS